MKRMHVQYLIQMVLSTDRYGQYTLGGLGHMAVKPAYAMGAEVTVLSQTLRKKEDGLRFGANHYYATSDLDTFRKLASSFDPIINTVSAKIDMNVYLSLQMSGIDS